MLAALWRAVGDLRHPALRRIIGLSFGLAAASFIGLWIGLGILLGQLSLVGSRYIDGIIGLLGAVAVLLLSWLLFPAVATLVLGCFLDRIAREVEAVDYPGLGHGRPPRWTATLMVTARLMAATIVLNLLALPLYLLLPVANIAIFAGLNGYLLGRGYFEVVALRRLDPILVRAARRRLGARLFVGGVVIAGVFAVPVVNLIAPVIATAFMVHLVESWRRAGSQFAAL